MPSIENKKNIAYKIAKDLANIHNDVFACWVNDFNQQGSFSIMVNVTNIGKRPNLISISRRIRSYLDKHPNVSLVGKKVKGPKALYSKYPDSKGKKQFATYESNLIEVDFTIVEDEEKVYVSTLTHKAG